jgi:uncharacterized protein (UPF0332 family)
MTERIEHKWNFRAERSREKLHLASLMLEKGRFNDSVINSYLSIFYSARLLLLHAGDDADDYEDILALAEKYYEPSGWSSIDIVGILRETKHFHDRIRSAGKTVTREEAERFYANASAVLGEITKSSSLHGFGETHAEPSL